MYKPNINADAKHISFVLLKFVTVLIRLMFFKYLFGKNVPNLRNPYCLKKNGGSTQF